MFSPSSGTMFHSLHATSQALQPMQIEVSVKKPIRGLASGESGAAWPALAATSCSGPDREFLAKRLIVGPSGSLAESSGGPPHQVVRVHRSVPVLAWTPARLRYSST